MNGILILVSELSAEQTRPAMVTRDRIVPPQVVAETWAPRVGLMVPALNAERNFESFLPALQAARPSLHRLLLLDSSSEDRTRELAKAAGFEVVSIRRSDFDHGGTRQLGVEILSDCDIIVCMTQDSVLTEAQAISRLVAPFRDPEIGATYGRQLPRIGAGLLEAYSRNFGYSDKSFVKSWPKSKGMGILAGAVSNSFAAYRRKDLLAVGGFPSNLVCTEDVYVGFKLILSNKKIAYVAESAVYHSHDYGVMEEFHRYFDIGAFYCAFEPWILKTAGAAEGRGLLFLKHQLKALLVKEPWLLPKCILSTITKYLGYRLGARWKIFPLRMRVWLGMNKAFWLRSESITHRPTAVSTP